MQNQMLKKVKQELLQPEIKCKILCHWEICIHRWLIEVACIFNLNQETLTMSSVMKIQMIQIWNPSKMMALKWIQ